MLWISIGSDPYDLPDPDQAQHLGRTDPGPGTRIILPDPDRYQWHLSVHDVDEKEKPVWTGTGTALNLSFKQILICNTVKT